MSRLKTVVISILLIIAMVVTFSACTGGGGTDTGTATTDAAAEDTAPAGEATDEIEPVELTFAHIGTPGSVVEHQYQLLADEISAASGGKITIKLFGAGSLLTQPEFYDGVTSGRVDIAEFNASYYAANIPELEVITIPSLYPGDRDKQANIYETLGVPINKILEKHNIRFLCGMACATAAFIGSVPVNDVNKDIKGLRVRVASKYAGKAVESWGGAAVNLPIADVPTGLERKTIDMVLTDFSSNQTMKLYEYAPKTTILDGNTVFVGPCINLDKWNSLSPAQQEAIQTGIDNYLPKTQDEFFTTMDKFYEDLPGLVNGGETIYATPEANQAIRDASWKILDDEFRSNANEDVQSLITAMESLK